MLTCGRISELQITAGAKERLVQEFLQENLNTTRNVWQSLANSPLGAAVSPPSK